MTSSAYAVPSALAVACPPKDAKRPGCGAPVGQRCRSKRVPEVEIQNCHPARRAVADAKRTAEVEEARRGEP